ncbi:cation-translocating P-type ATPase [Candidatus Amoebophilus asiaticus]|nr:cation-translocating P-type ATPase [Candidatus Amoebophilus asiaticus]
MTETDEKIEFVVKGMTCANCAYGVTKFIEKNNGIDVNVDIGTGRVSMKLDDKDAVANKLQEIYHGIKQLGYQVETKEEKRNADDRRSNVFSPLEIKFFISLLFTLPLFLAMFIPYPVLHNPYLQFFLCVPVYTIGVMHFGKSAFISLKIGIPNMDVLIFIGSSAAFIYSLIGMIYNLGPDYLFYETSATIITLVLLGNYIEHRTVKKTSSAIEDLSKIQATKARKIVNVNNEEKVIELAYEEIQVGDILLVNTGDKIPVDGYVIWGEGTADESMITGESTPVEKKVSTKVIGGTILNDGNLKIEASKVGEDTILAHIIELVRNAQASRPSIQKLGDKVSAVFVPIVILIAITTFGASFWLFTIPLQASLMSSIAVLVIACPCAMGLATPTAVAVGIGRAAKNGVLIKGGSTLEEMANIQNIVFDKTGTLTTGDFRIKNIQYFNGANEDEVKNLVYNLEQHSSHPIARSLIKECGKNAQPIINFTEINEEKGRGIKVRNELNDVYEIGSFSIAEGLTKEDDHTLYLVMNRKLLATIDLEDEIKANAREVMEKLKNHGIITYLLSGDRHKKCEEIAAKLKMDKVYSEKLPHEKLQIIDDLSKKEPTAMVGDGINDAPALAKANVGISLSDGTEIAIQSAQIVLLRGDLNYLIKAVAISKHTLLTIKQNLFWAFLYNALAIPIAAVGLLNPMVAALSMAFSDVIVIGNSLRFKTKRIF